MSWISLKKELPRSGEWVYWYDAMFDQYQYFALVVPARHDGDYTHFSRSEPTERPIEYLESFRYRSMQFYDPKLYEMEKENRLTIRFVGSLFL